MSGGGGGSGCQGTDSGAAVVTVEGNKSAATNPLLKVLEGGGEEAKELVRDKGGIEITEATHGNLHAHHGIRTPSHSHCNGELCGSFVVFRKA